MTVDDHRSSEDDFTDWVDQDTNQQVDAFAAQVGQRLRAIRQQKGLSLNQVEIRSDFEFRSSVLGAYERGERSLAVGRMMRLATIYGVPADQLLPGAALDPHGAGQPGRPLRINLPAVARLGGPEGEHLRRQLGLVQLVRQDFNGKVMTVRRDDERVIAGLFGVRQQRIRTHLDELGLLADEG
jgi:transcriptional regulator with XRE-family HTH domain